MFTASMQICVETPIPDASLNSLAGWLLRAHLDSATEVVDDVPCSVFFAEDEAREGAEVDDEFIRYFLSAQADDQLKDALLQSNPDLEDDLTCGTHVSTFELDLDEIIQRVVAESGGALSAVELIVVYGADHVRPGSIGGYCSFITASETSSFSYEDWLFEQRSCHDAKAKSQSV